MDELLLEGVVVSRLDDRLREGASWDGCTLIARPHAQACSLQLKLGKRSVTCHNMCTSVFCRILICPLHHVTTTDKGNDVTIYKFSCPSDFVQCANILCMQSLQC